MFWNFWLTVHRWHLERASRASQAPGASRPSEGLCLNFKGDPSSPSVGGLIESAASQRPRLVDSVVNTGLCNTPDLVATRGGGVKAQRPCGPAGLSPGAGNHCGCRYFQLPAPRSLHLEACTLHLESVFLLNIDPFGGARLLLVFCRRSGTSRICRLTARELGNWAWIHPRRAVPRRPSRSIRATDESIFYLFRPRKQKTQEKPLPQTEFCHQDR